MKPNKRDKKRKDKRRRKRDSKPQLEENEKGSLSLSRNRPDLPLRVQSRS